MEGPYRDLGSGFARLTGAEGARRSPSGLRHAEDALLELVRNACDAGARNVLVASTLRRRRYRTLTVLDDGHGIPESHRALIFEPGVTSRHLVSPVPADAPRAGLALYHIKQAALSAEVLSTSSPTAIKVTLDTYTLPERTLQSPSRPSRSNLLATLQNFHNSVHYPPAKDLRHLYYASPARILATLLYHHIILWPRTTRELWGRAGSLGLGVSLRTAQRVWRGEVAPAAEVELGGERLARARGRGGSGGRPAGGVAGEPGAGLAHDGAVLVLGEEERAGIADILRRAARASYLELGEVGFRGAPGEIWVRASVYEPEEEYE